MIRQYQSFWANDCEELDQRLNELARMKGDLKLEALQPNAASGDILAVISFWAPDVEVGRCHRCGQAILARESFIADEPLRWHQKCWGVALSG